MLYKEKTVKVKLTMKVAICDNDFDFIDEMQRRIYDYFASHNIAGEYISFNSPKKLLAAELTSVGAVFLDIEMPEIDGINVAGLLKEKYPDIVLVFVTNYLEYAPAGYRVDAFRYLLKSRIPQELNYVLNEVIEKVCDERANIRVKYRGDDIILQLKDIVYIEGTARRTVIIHLIGENKALECNGKLSEFEVKLNSAGFIRLQRSFLANMRHMKKISGYKAYFNDGNVLNVSEINYNSLRKLFLEWKVNKI